jgi:uncharacterized protein YjbI with pentapeptide repeats
MLSASVGGETCFNHCDFSEINMIVGGYAFCNFQECNFTDATLSQSNFYASNFERSDFTNTCADLSNFSSCNLMLVDFNKANVYGSNFTDAILTKSRTLNIGTTKKTLGLLKSKKVKEIG